MEKILIINTGGTFNKRYNPLKGELEVPKDGIAPETILQFCHNTSYELLNLIHKDSLDMLDSDRDILVKTIQEKALKKVLIVHGTDTMDQSARYLAERLPEHIITLTGTMVPFSIEKVESTANFMMALGDVMRNEEKGVYIAMHGIVAPHASIYKNREKGIFELV